MHSFAFEREWLIMLLLFSFTSTSNSYYSRCILLCSAIPLVYDARAAWITIDPVCGCVCVVDSARLLYSLQDAYQET